MGTLGTVQAPLGLPTLWCTAQSLVRNATVLHPGPSIFVTLLRDPQLSQS